MLVAEAVTISRGRRRVLEELSFTLDLGEVVALVGPNGSGKSTLLKVLAGELIPEMGRVTLDGRPLIAWSRRALTRRRAVLPQHNRLAFPFRVEEVVRLGRYPWPKDPERDRAIVGAALAAVDGEQLVGRSFLTLSGGERQRVQLARVLAQVWEGKGFLLLDEPIAALDLAHQHGLLAKLRELALSFKIGVLAVLHDLNLAAWYADRIGILRSGRLVALGRPEEVLTSERLSEVFALKVLALREANGRVRVLADVV